MVTGYAQLGSVLSVDRTFNLGTYFLTAITFKNKKVTFRNNSSYPVFLGPCFIHKQAREEDHNFLFSYIKSKILNNFPTFNFSTLCFVTDGEQALTNFITTQSLGVIYILIKTFIL